MEENRESVEFIEKYMDKWDQETNYGEDLSVLEVWEQNAYIVESMNTEVHSAGFAGYLESDYFPGEKRLKEALETVGAKKVCLIFEDVRNSFPSHHIPEDPDGLEDLLEDTDLDALDDRFYEYPDPLSELVKNYILEHETM